MPALEARGQRLGLRRRPRRRRRSTRVVAAVETSARPIAPPTWNAAVTMPEAAPASSCGHLGDGGDLVRDADQRQPEAEDDQAREDVGDVAGVGAGAAEQQQADDADGGSDQVRGAGADAG